MSVAHQLMSLPGPVWPSQSIYSYSFDLPIHLRNRSLPWPPQDTRSRRKEMKWRRHTYSGGKKTAWALYTYPTRGTLIDGNCVKKKSSQIKKSEDLWCDSKKSWQKKGWSKGWHTKKGSCKHNKDRKASKTSRKNAALWQSTVLKLCLLVSK